jgi:tRNA(Ile)-lysidine synthase
LTAHTADDQLESFFVDLLTGASIYTLGGVSETNGRIIRPFLDVTTEMIYSYLKNEGLDYVYDSSNSELNFRRNLVRERFMPLLDEFGEIKKTIGRIQQESRFLNKCFSESTESVIKCEDGVVIIRRDVFDGLSRPEKYFVLGKWLSMLCRGGHIHAEAIMEQLSRQRTARLSMPERYMCEISPRAIRIFPKSMVQEFEVVKKSGESEITLPNGRHVRFSGDMVDREILLRSRIDGDRFEGRKVKDMFHSRKIDLFDRDRAVVIVEDGKIVWVEYVVKGDKIV